MSISNSLTWNFTHCYVAARIAGEFKREWIDVYVCQSAFAVYLKLSRFQSAILNTK